MGSGFGAASSWAATSLSLGARKGNVTVLPACTSGEISGAGGVCAGAPAATSRMVSPNNVCLMIALCETPIEVSIPKWLRRGMIQQAALCREEWGNPTRVSLRLHKFENANGGNRRKRGGLKSAPA